ncbi:hypothetical protein FB45DRAFT_1005139 [Roridomyces roridus]|uniref:Uncharacterized protein n=1 Tax=Roridomyces roridus TaxID=1738132 RepID=A0AAD7BN34_9AGAR|nr:hypothetical protein FB45DRAFT_1005139 [Roridomyces roridus]
MHFLSLTATALICTAVLVRGSPLPLITLESRAGVKFHILTAGPESCNAAQTAAIKAGIVDTKLMASVALKTLTNAGVEGSEGYKSFFGSAPLASIQERFGFVNQLGTPDEITSLDGVQGSQTDLVFTCLANDPKANVIANTRNIGRLTKADKGVLPTDNRIRFSPRTTSVTDTLTEFAARLIANGNKFQKSIFKLGKLEETDPDDSALPIPPMAFILCPVGADKHLVDLKDHQGVKADGVRQVQVGLDDDKKAQNPQNYAFFALFAQAQPEAFTSGCPATEDSQPLGVRRSFSRTAACPAQTGFDGDDFDMGFDDDDD